MPKINRIRIINFFYNNDNREIQDETYKLYDGENTLFNLSNGGGKSVLIQLLMQPVIPDLKIQKRNMASYFKRSTMPAFIMIEWRLDNAAKKDYLLTGIAVAPGGGSSEESNKINYYTFMSHYDRAVDFDIASVPFVSKDGEKLTILPYERSREEVKKLAGSYREVFYFSRDDAADYRRQLLQFGIAQEEWKNIIAKMNNDEGGIDELFERCTTSDSVFNEWILKTVEKAVMAEQENETQIQDLLDGLAEDTLKNESYIQDEQILKAYFQVHEGMEQQLDTLFKAVEHYEGVKQRLASMYGCIEHKLQKERFALEELDIREQEHWDENAQIEKEEASEHYYIAKEELIEADEAFSEKEEQLSDKKTEFQETKQNIRIQQAAQINGELQRTKAATEAIGLKLSQMEQGDEVSVRLMNLKYSLKIRYEQIRDELTGAYQQLTTEKQAAGVRLTELKHEIGQLNQEILAATGQLGALKEKIKVFEAYEESLLKHLGFQLSRNILKELDVAEARQKEVQMELVLSEQHLVMEQLSRRLPLIQEELEQIQSHIVENTKLIANTDSEIAVQRQEITRFEEQQQDCLALLQKYEIEPEFLYDKETVSHQLRQKEEALQERKRLSSLEEDQIREMIWGIRENRIYLPGLILGELEYHDIDYTSGEAYLANLSEQQRQQLLAGNPLLPFSLLVRERDIVKLDQVKLKELFLRQIIPVFTYEQLNQSFTEKNQLLAISDELSLISCYEKQIFVDEDKVRYLKQLEQQHEELQGTIKQLEEGIKEIHRDESCIAAFLYTKDDGRRMAEQLAVLVKQLESLQQQEIALLKEKSKQQEEQETVKAEWEEKKETCRKLEQNILQYKEYLEKDVAYISDVREVLNLDIQMQMKGLQKQKAETAQTELSQQLSKTEQQIMDVQQQTEQNQKQVVQFQDAKEAEYLEGTTEFLLVQYEELNQELQTSVQELERRLREGREKQAELEAELEDLVLAQEVYQGVIYDKVLLRRLKESESRLEAAVEQLQGELLEKQNIRSRAKAHMETAESQLQKLNLKEPLVRQLIKQNYENRRKQIRFELGKLAEERKGIRALVSTCEQVNGLIKQLLPVEIIRYQAFTLSDDIKGQYESLLNEYKAGSHQYEQQISQFQKQYQDVRAEYYEKHSCIADILDSVKQMGLNQKEQSHETLYFHIEEFIKKKENLRKLLDFYAAQLENISHTKKQIIDQCVSYATMIYEDIRLISNRSRIRLSGRSRSVQMLKLDIPKELDNQVYLRMERHIDHSLKLMVDLSRNEPDKNSRKYRDKIRGLTSTRELLNQLIGTNRIPVSVYKIDMNDSNSGLKKWEEAISENSGGEKFVVFFTMVSVLISYSREAAGRSLGVDAMNDSKVILMDNPFARTSSEHLLKAVIDIAKTFHVQLICFSDLSQSSITNRFALIYQLAVRKKMYSQKEVLKIGAVQMNKDGLRENERLEHASVYERFVQRSLFDTMQ